MCETLCKKQQFYTHGLKALVHLKKEKKKNNNNNLPAADPAKNLRKCDCPKLFRKT